MFHMRIIREHCEQKVILPERSCYRCRILDRRKKGLMDFFNLQISQEPGIFAKRQHDFESEYPNHSSGGVHAYVKPLVHRGNFANPIYLVKKLYVT